VPELTNHLPNNKVREGKNRQKVRPMLKNNAYSSVSCIPVAAIANASIFAGSSQKRSRMQLKRQG